MQISLEKDLSSQPGDILAHVHFSSSDHVSASNDPTQVHTYSHSFRYKVPSGKNGEIIVYIDKDAASKDVNGDSFSFDLEKCRNKECKEKNPGGCPVIAGKPNRLLVADIFHTMPTQNTLQYFGTALFKALFSHRAERQLRKTEQTDLSNGIFVQLNKHDGDLDAIPWEYAIDGTTFLVHRHKFTRVLAHPLARPYDPLPKLPLRIVAAVPDPLDLFELNLADLHLGDQFQNFINEFRRDSVNVTLERVLPATVDKMNSLLAKRDNNMGTVLHFMGHCVAHQKTRGLLFEDGETFKCKVANTQNLVTVPKNLRLAFLSACDSREVARDLVQNGVRQTIGSYCPLPDDIARKSEAQFYRYLAQGLSVDDAMWRMRMNFQDSKELRESDYLAGAMIFYSANCQATDNIFLCESGELKIKLNMFPNNLNILSSPKDFFGRKKQLAALSDVLRRMAARTNDSFDLCTITGIGGQGKTMLAKEVVYRTGHFFPGGIFVWRFDDNMEISARDYLRGLAGVLFSEDTQNSVEVEILGKVISSQFKASSLLILDHADTLKRAASEAKPDAKFLADWLRRIISNREISVKVLATSQEPLGWLREKVVPLEGLIDSDIKSGCRLFAENLNPEAKTKIQKEKNSKNLLGELVIRVDGHPLSLRLLGNAVGLQDYLDKPLEGIVHEYYSTMLADADVEKELKGHFKPKIEALTKIEQSLLYMSSLFDGLITAEVLALVRYFVDYNGDCSAEVVTKSLEQFCKNGYLFKENDAFRIHVGFREGLRQHNDKLNIIVYLPKIGPVDTFLFGIPSEQGKSNVLEWQLRNIQSNSDNGVERTFGIQYCNIANNLDTNSYKLEVTFRGLVVFILEASGKFPDTFAELSTKQIKPIVEKRELPFILCFRCSRAKTTEWKKAMNALQDVLRASHLIVRTEPLNKLSNVSNINTITKKPSAKRKLAGVHTYGDFVGREKELKLLKELLDDNGKNIRYITILGFGGMGKTTLAIQAVRNFDSERVLVLSFVKNPSFKSMISKIAEFLCINIKESEDLETDVLNKLEDEETMLFYLDNMETLKQASENTKINLKKEREEAESIFRFFNEIPSNVKILATSRVKLGWPGEYLITLMGLERQDGMQVFRQWTSQRSNDFNDEDAKKINDVANGHPLSIRLLGGAFNNCKRPINEFIVNIREHLQKAKDSLDRRYDSVNTCIHYSYDYLDENLKQLLCQLRRFITPFSVTIVSKALGRNTMLSSTLSTEDSIYVLCQQSWLNEVKYISTLGDWRPRLMESDIDFYTLHPRLRDFLDHQFSSIEVTDFDDSDIQFYTALCYATGFGVVNDFEKQMEWCTKAAENEHLEAQLCLAACYEYGAGGTSLNAERAFYWYLKAAEAGDRGAQHEVSVCYLHGKGVEQNWENSNKWEDSYNDNKTQPLEMKFDFTLSLLHRAAENDQVDLVRSLIEQGSVKATVKDRHGRTPLHLAAEKGHIEVVKLLAIEFNVEINVVDKKNRTSLHLAALNGHTEVIRLLVTELGADVRTKDEDNRTLLHAAAAGGIGIDVIRLLVDRLGKNVDDSDDDADGDADGNYRDYDIDDFQIDAKDRNEQIPLHYAAMNGHINVMRMLVTEFGANVNAGDRNGRTPLHAAAENGRFEAMRMLVAELGADKDEKDNHGATLLHYAVKGGLHAIVKGSLCSAAMDGHIDVVSLLVAELGTGINPKDGHGWTLLHWAALGGQVEAMKQLMLKFPPMNLDFNESYIGTKRACALAESLKQNTTLIELNLYNNNISAEGAHALAESLKQNTTLTELNLGENNIGAKGAYAIAKFLKQNMTLTKLNLESNNIGAEGTRALAESLKQNITLTELSLENNKIGNEGAHALAESLKLNITLTKLNLGVSNIGTEGVYALAKSLQQNIALIELNLRGNNIGAKGAHILTKSLKQNITLIELNLINNNIGAEGAYTLAEFLKQNTTLTKLILEMNNICTEGSYALAESLKQNITLTKLMLERNNIDTKGACALAESLKQNMTLTELNLSFNDIDTEGACALAKSLKQNRTLTDLNLKGNNIDAEGAHALAESLKQNMTLTELNLRDNDVDAEGAYALSESLNRNKILIKIFKTINLSMAEAEIEINIKSNNGGTQLDMANLRDLLMEFGKNISANGGLTPLHVIVMYGHIGLVKLLAGAFGANANSLDNNGWTPLHMAAARGYDEVVKLLVTELGANPNAKDNNGQTPLHWAVGNGHINIVKLLATEHGADITAKDNDGWTPLHGFAQVWFFEIMGLLVTNFGTDANAEANASQTSFDWIVTSKKVDIMALLVPELGTDATIKTKAIQYLVHDWYVKVAKLLVAEYGVNVNAKVDRDWYIKVIKLPIIKHGANVEPVDGDAENSVAKQDKTSDAKGNDAEDDMDAEDRDAEDLALLHLAARDGHVELVRLLVTEFEVDPNLKNNDNLTPVYLASLKGHVNVVKLLVKELGAEIISTPVQLAEQRGHVEIITKLLDSDKNKSSDGSRDSTALGIQDVENIQLEEGEEPNLSSNEGDSGNKSQKEKEPQRGSGDDGLIWKTTVAVVSVGAAICIAWLLWGRMGSRRRLRRP